MVSHSNQTIATQFLAGVACVAAGLVFAASVAAQPPVPLYRYLATFADGSKAGGPAIPSWPIAGSDSRMDRKVLFAADNPVRLIRDQMAAVEGKAPLVMLANGDVVNGSAVGLVEAAGGSRLKVHSSGWAWRPRSAHRRRANRPHRRRRRRHL